MIFQIIIYLSFNVLSLYGQPDCTSCPANGIWANWVDTSACSATCGLFGTKTQERACSSAEKGCACTGDSSRTVPCPGGPICTGGAAQQCMAPYPKYVNTATKRFECGPVTNPNDDEAPPCTMTNPACSFCTLATPLTISSDSGYTPFAGDSLSTDGTTGCVERLLTCTSTAGNGPWPANIDFNNHAAQGPQTGEDEDTVQATLLCNFDGTGWNYTDVPSSTTFAVTDAGCQAVTCEDYPTLCE